MKLKEYIPEDPFLKSKIFQKLFEIRQKLIDKFDFDIQDLIDQAYIHTATWGLTAWEKELGIPVNEEDTYEKRRARCLAKIRGYGNCTIEHLKNVCASFNYADNIDIDEHFEDYFFNIILNSYNGFPKSMEDLYSIVREISPAHLGIHYKLRAITKSNLNIAAVGFTGEIIRVYPWSVDNIKSEIDVYIPAIQRRGLETIRVCPKEEV